MNFMKRQMVTLTNGKPGVRLAMACEVRVLDAKKGIAEYIASDESVDSYREVIRVDGWRFNMFRKNAPFVDSHDYSTIENLLGKVIDFEIRKKALVETVQWAIDVAEQPLAQLGWKLTEGGYLKAVSVGFWPVKMVSRWDGNPSGFNQQIAELGIKPDDAACPRCIFVEQEQIELSSCIVGANPNAVQLARAVKAGIIDDAEINFIDQECSRRAKNIHTGAADEAADAAPVPRRQRVQGGGSFLDRLEKAIKTI